ncbi:hypothetical protein ARC20_12455 [Stenotrophomonas panacihumi]|uniref:DUF2188 domain-containing protein n=1 Tax=Stenotrophomonas panacihumi TaxID=676599 RepID=A0A0R0AG63_9GAMM|nr:DUF2188 domain-containing protein [Stenotrophomonas panacihumi]KRG40830.1 hypothetical protein ARC20_12455 [Stenotrophomonas panacihumi]PTN55089.1 DUF2188 domain-containing protein [Stenotrophomonas panacihumi]
MERKYWYVVMHINGWAVREGDGILAAGAARQFRMQEEALEYARFQARAANRATGGLTGVRIQGSDARWREGWSYGLDPVSASG